MLVDHFHNLNKARSPYSDELKSILNLLDSKEAFDEISTWDGHKPTPLLSLKDIALQTGVKKIYYKDESSRFGLGSFKALGGTCLLYTSPSPRDQRGSRMPSSA